MIRKLFTIVVILCLSCCGSIATATSNFDLSGLSFDELVSLKEQINLAIWNSEEWEEVEVPQGVYKVGADIPAGHWTLKCADNWLFSKISWGEYLSESGESIHWEGRNSTYNLIYNPDHEFYQEGDGAIEYSCEIRNGEYIIIYDGSVVFTPYNAKPSFTFKSQSNTEQEVSASGEAGTHTPITTKTPSEKDKLSQYMRDDNGVLMFNDTIKGLFTENMGKYASELLTAIVDYAILCVEADGIDGVSAEATSDFILTSFDIVLTKLTKETTIPPNLSEEEKQVLLNCTPFVRQVCYT